MHNIDTGTLMSQGNVCPGDKPISDKSIGQIGFLASDALHEVFGLPLSEKLEKKEVTEAGDNVQEIYSHGISSKIMTINY